MLFSSLTIEFVTLMVISILKSNLTYYFIAFFDLFVAGSLLSSLIQMLTVMAVIPQLQNFEGKEMAKYFVNSFGLSFIVAGGCNFLKSYFYHTKYVYIVQ